MHCFTLFLCQGGGVSGIYATFATYRVLTFNKHIYGSQKSPKADLEGKEPRGCCSASYWSWQRCS